MSSRGITTVTTTEIPDSENNLGVTALVIAVAIGSIGPIIIRMALGAGVSPVSVVALRLTFATLLLTPIVLRRYTAQLRQISRRQLLLIALSGFWLALHFMGFTGALDNTSVLIATVIIATNPLWAAILEALFLRAKAHPLVWVGILFAIAGGVIIAFGGSATGTNNPNPLLGGLLSLGGAIASATYMIIGRKAQTRLSLVPYIWLVYSFASITAVIISVLSGNSLTGYSLEGYFWVVVITFSLQIVTHGSINLALRYFSATYVSISLQASVIGNVLLASVFFDEVPKELQLVGAATIVIGVILASIGRGQARIASAQAKS